MSDALSPERIAAVLSGAVHELAHAKLHDLPVQRDHAETILALLDERARLVAVAEALQNGERGPALWDALAAWKAGAK